MAKKKEKGGLMGKLLGVKAKPAPSQDDEERKVRHDRIGRAWAFLRYQIDEAAKEYQSTGSSQKLQQFVERPALDALTKELDKLREAGVVWEQPDRPAVTEPKLEVIDEELNQRNQPVQFVIRERFRDYSVLHDPQGAEKRCPGEERVIQATVNITNGTEFTLQHVIEVRSATLG
jgi:hypothetical protein